MVYNKINTKIQKRRILMKMCKICGKAMDDTYNICPYCGAAFSENAASDTDVHAESDYAQQNDHNTPPQFRSQNYQYGQNMPPYGDPSYYSQPQNISSDYTPEPRPQRSAYISAFLAFFFGMFGLHNFYLDKKNRALVQLLVSVLASVPTFGLAPLAMYIWAVIEGVKLLKGEINLDGKGVKIKMSF